VTEICEIANEQLQAVRDDIMLRIGSRIGDRKASVSLNLKVGCFL
jgi:hypothetical protein